jgi:nitrite reductase/ring-hydroxylating ferredoxin subunit
VSQEERKGGSTGLTSGRSALDDAWLPVGTVAELGRVGDYRARELPGVQIVVLRTADGARIFRNECPHEAYPLVDPDTAGRAAMLVCPWHGWAFTLDGIFRPVRLRRDEAEPGGAERSRLDLEPLPCVESDGLVWSSAGRPAAVPPVLDPPFMSGAPPARARSAAPWEEVRERIEGTSVRVLGPASFVVPFGHDGRCVLTILPRPGGGTQVLGWTDPGSAPMPFGVDRVAFLRDLIGPGAAG